MESHSSGIKILAIELRSARFGHAFFEGHTLLDWGTNSYKPKSMTGFSLAKSRLSLLLNAFSPSVIVIRGSRDQKRSERIEEALSYLDHQSNARSVPIDYVGPEEIKEKLTLSSEATKYDVANSLASVFPELAWKLPCKRRAWQSEPRRMIHFDVIAAGYAYWLRYVKNDCEID